MLTRVGFGFDVHEFEVGRRLILGGVDVPHSAGLKGHSDADVVIHAVVDALLGAAGLGDIGQHFPDSDPQFKDINSRKLLRRITGLLEEQGWNISNIDITVVAQVPKIQPHSAMMQKNIAEDLKISEGLVSVKGHNNGVVGVYRKERRNRCLGDYSFSF